MQGAQQIKGRYSQAVAIFLLPPSREHLERRLIGRGTDDPETVRQRLDNACREISALPSYDYAIVNDDLSVAVDQFLAILTAERCRLDRIRSKDRDAVVRAFDPRS